MPNRVKGKVAIVTGAGQGIGRGCARMLAQEGASVVIADVQDAVAEAAVEDIRNLGGEAVYCRADVVAEEQCSRLMEEAVSKYGRLDVLVNNAGWFPRATLEETTTELWDKVLNTNLRGAFYCCKYAIPHMRATGGGSIVNMGSINGIQGLPNLMAYSAAKGGLISLTRTMAGAYAGDRIRVNYLIPGWVLTEGEVALHKEQGVTEEQLRRMGATLPLGRHQTPEDIAYAVTYLASDESAQVTGTVINVDAGASTLPLQPRPSYAD
jgi:NAD(P)-dependent dehydrogenase (short-subunit alcohol dehydrogenase family)